MRVKMELKGALRAEFIVPAQNVVDALKWLEENMPVTLEADHLEITKRQPTLKSVKNE